MDPSTRRLPKEKSGTYLFEEKESDGFRVGTISVAAKYLYLHKDAELIHFPASGLSLNFNRRQYNICISMSLIILYICWCMV